MKTHDQKLCSRVDEVKLRYKTKTKASDRIKINNSRKAYDTLLLHWDTETIELQEEFKILLLNRSHAVLGIADISVGGITGTVIDIRKILQLALKSNCTSIILAHNHPSGNTQPSEADINVTKRIKNAGAIMDINILDHIVVCKDNSFYSFADEGII